MSVLLVCMCITCLVATEVRRIKGEPPRGSGNQTEGSLQEQSVLLMTKPSLKLLYFSSSTSFQVHEQRNGLNSLNTFQCDICHCPVLAQRNITNVSDSGPASLQREM